MIGRGRFGVILLLVILVATPSIAIRNNEARVTKVVRDVQVLGGDPAPRAASLNDRVADGAAVRTGSDSRAELTFPDLTLTRIGANSLFSFSQAGHAIEVDNGAILLRLPRNSGGARIRSDIVTVGIPEATVLFEARRGDYNKLIVLEGQARASLRARPEQTVILHAGQMLIVEPRATRLPAPVEIDLALVMNTATLITRFPPLPSLNLILAAIENQKGSGVQLANPDVVSTGLGARDVVAAIRSEATPSPPKSGKPPGVVGKP